MKDNQHKKPISLEEKITFISENVQKMHENANTAILMAVMGAILIGGVLVISMATASPIISEGADIARGLILSITGAGTTCAAIASGAFKIKEMTQIKQLRNFKAKKRQLDNEKNISKIELEKQNNNIQEHKDHTFDFAKSNPYATKRLYTMHELEQAKSDLIKATRENNETVTKSKN